MIYLPEDNRATFITGTHGGEGPRLLTRYSSISGTVASKGVSSQRCIGTVCYTLPSFGHKAVNRTLVAEDRDGQQIADTNFICYALNPDTSSLYRRSSWFYGNASGMGGIAWSVSSDEGWNVSDNWNDASPPLCIELDLAGFAGHAYELFGSGRIYLLADLYGTGDFSSQTSPDVALDVAFMCFYSYTASGSGGSSAYCSGGPLSDNGHYTVRGHVLESNRQSEGTDHWTWSTNAVVGDVSTDARNYSKCKLSVTPIVVPESARFRPSRPAIRIAAIWTPEP